MLFMLGWYQDFFFKTIKKSEHLLQSYNEKQLVYENVVWEIP